MPSGEHYTISASRAPFVLQAPISLHRHLAKNVLCVKSRTKGFEAMLDYPMMAHKKQDKTEECLENYREDSDTRQ